MTATKNLWAGLILGLIGLSIVFIAIPYGVDEPKKIKFAALSPAYYPRIVAIVMTILGLVIAMRAVTRPIKSNAEADRPDATARICIVFCLLIFYALSINFLGFVLASAIALFAFMFHAGERRVWLMALLATAIPFGLFLFFQKIAGIPIPTGVLAPLLNRI
jgi:putative tricarboxylic transport membrane protein|tara:strand:+ start:151 stop:636 length:486 start_codon:yes stop_codon:yes gene_type:complete